MKFLDMLDSPGFIVNIDESILARENIIKAMQIKVFRLGNV